MKKTLLITLATGAMAASALAQGSISFQASAANGLVSYSLDNGATIAGSVPIGSAGGVPVFGIGNVAIYSAPNGTAVTLDAGGLPSFGGAWSVAGSVLGITPTPGKTAATSYTLAAASVAPGANVELEIVGWTGTATSWADAVAQGGDLYGYTGELVNGVALGSLGWSQPTGNPTSVPPGTPAPVVTGAGGYQGLVLKNVPEPTTIALLSASLVTLAFLRKRHGVRK